MSSIARSARACISSSVRSWMGWATKTQAGLKPSAVDWAMAASRNGSEATNTVGTPRASRLVVSCTLHVVHDPQSASPSMTASHSADICCWRSTEAGRVNVGLRYRLTDSPRSARCDSIRSRKTSPRFLDMSSRPMVSPSKEAARSDLSRFDGFCSDVGSSNTVVFFILYLPCNRLTSTPTADDG